MFGWYDSSDGLSASFPGEVTASKIAKNTYRIDIFIWMNVVSAPEQYFSYGVYVPIICQRLFNKSPVSIYTGHYMLYKSDGSLDNDSLGYGAAFVLQEQYYLGLGRYYESSGGFGGWPLSNFVGKRYVLNGFFFVQI